MSEPIYPDITNFVEQDEEGHITLDDKQLQKIFYDDRYNLMTQKKEELTANVKRYLKSKSRYSLANSIQKIVSLVVTSSLTVATIVLTSGIAIPFFLIPTASGMSLFFIGLSTSLDKMIRSKKSHLKHKIDNISTLLAKMEVYIERAREDHIISPEEVSQFNKLLEEEKKKKNKKGKDNNIDIQQLIEEIIKKELTKSA